MGRYGRDITHPLVKWFQVAALIKELCGHVLPHHVNLEGSKHLIGVAQVLIEEPVVCRWLWSLGKPLNGSFIDDTQHLTPDGRLYLVGRVEAIIDFAQELAEDISIKADGVVKLGCGTTATYTTMMPFVFTVVEIINQKSVSAPVFGAIPKKRLKRFLNAFLSVFKGCFPDREPSGTLAPLRAARAASRCVSASAFCLS